MALITDILTRLVWPGPELELSKADFLPFVEEISAVEGSETRYFRTAPNSRNKLKVVKKGDILQIKAKYIPQGGFFVPSDDGADPGPAPIYLNIESATSRFNR